MASDSILSAGIDVGTTSTHLTLSRLRLANAARANEPDRTVVTGSEIVYQSPIHLTPLIEERESAQLIIDHEAVLELLVREYETAGITAAAVATGAVIITGETARARNARAVADAVSTLAGQFVVASAGPNLESVLAARGSGAVAASRQQQKTICNIDIGGGTSNIAVFTNGELIETATLAIGGRMMRLGDHLEVARLSDSGTILNEMSARQSLRIGAPVDLAAAEQLAGVAAQVLLDALQGRTIEVRLLVAGGSIECRNIDQFWFSGGVGEIMRAQGTSSVSATEYGDLGVFLAEALLKLFKHQNLSYHLPERPIRATVIGAGAHSLQLSGSTISAPPGLLPLTNLPLVRPLQKTSTDLRGAGSPPSCSDLEMQLRSAFSQIDLDWSEQPVALFLPELERMSLKPLSEWAEALVAVFQNLRGRRPLVIVCHHDVAAALGQLIRQLMPGEDLIVLDGIAPDIGSDYIDIGSPLGEHRCLPVVLKDLVFG